MGNSERRIDSHQHFWDPTATSYPWMVGEKMDSIRRAFSPVDLSPILAGQGIDGTVLVQTVSSLHETRAFLELTAEWGFIWGVVGWVDLTSPAVGDDLDALLSGSGGGRLVGIRHQVHDEDDANWLRRDDVRRGLVEVQRRGLTYDLLVRAREIPAAVATIKALPDMQFVVDHIAKPRIADGSDEAWRERMPDLAKQANVVVKLSGMVTEAKWDDWTPSDLEPYVSAVVEWFGVERVMFGSDWPVCLLATSYQGVVRGLHEALGPLSPGEETLIFGQTAERVYRLTPG